MILSRDDWSEGAAIVGKDGVEKVLPLDQARKFSVFEREKIDIAIGDRVRLTRNVKLRGRKFLNNELRTVVGIDQGKIVFDKGEIMLHLRKSFWFSGFQKFFVQSLSGEDRIELVRYCSRSVLVRRPYHTAKSDVIVAGVDVPFAACPHHVTGAILIGAEK